MSANTKVEIEITARTQGAVEGIKRLAGETSKAKAAAEQLTAAQQRQAHQLEITRARVQNTNERFSAFDAAVSRATASTKGGAASVESLGAVFSKIKTPLMA